MYIHFYVTDKTQQNVILLYKVNHKGFCFKLKCAIKP